MNATQLQLNQQRIIIWRFVDGKPGHEKQSLGLVNALSKISKVNSQKIKCANLNFRNFYEILRKLVFSPDKIEYPDLLIGAGHRTHFPILILNKFFGGKSVILMKPSLPCSWFNLCIIPKHDNLTPTKNIILTDGVLNAIDPSTIDATQKDGGIFLIGGESKHFSWSTENIIEQIKKIIVASGSTSWSLTTSRRTPKDFLEKLKSQNFPNIKIIEHSKTKLGWIEQTLIKKEYAWITEDSFSMIYESITAQCKVGVLNLKKLGKESKAEKSIKSLLKRKIICKYDDLNKNNNTQKEKPLSHQALHCAEYVKKNLLVL